MAFYRRVHLNQLNSAHVTDGETEAQRSGVVDQKEPAVDPSGS